MMGRRPIDRPLLILFIFISVFIYLYSRRSSSPSSKMAARLTLNSPIKLNTGYSIPVLALGVYQARGDECYNAVLAALEAGYRHIDSAAWYGNEADVGRAVSAWMKKTGGKREDKIFFTTKLRDPDHGYTKTKAAIDTSLSKWGHGYIDLYLIHSPLTGTKRRLEAWKAIEDAIDAGKIRSGGVSNYGVHHLQELLNTKPRYVPSVNQVELHPFLQRKDIDDYCKKHGIYLEAYSPLTRGQRLNDPALVPIAKAHGKTVAQILIRYTLQKGWITLPKSVTKERIISNAQVFGWELSADDMKKLDSLECYGVTGWDPTTAK